jgi:hypothetical protein
MPEGDGDWAISLSSLVLADPGSIAHPAEDARLVPVDFGYHSRSGSSAGTGALSTA